MVILSAVIASVVSEIGLGSEPAFTVPGYDFRSPSGNFLELFCICHNHAWLHPWRQKALSNLDECTCYTF